MRFYHTKMLSIHEPKDNAAAADCTFRIVRSDYRRVVEAMRDVTRYGSMFDAGRLSS